TGDRIFVDKISYRLGEPEQGDVVVFEGPDSWNEGYQSIRSDNPVLRTLQNIGGVIGVLPPDQNDLVKRVIAVGGQTVGGCSPEGDLLVDGEPLDEPYLNEPPDPSRDALNCAFGPVTVPEDSYWVMGDNRNNSADSRFHMGDEHQGTVPGANIIGKVQAIILPLDRIGSVSSADIMAGGRLSVRGGGGSPGGPEGSRSRPRSRGGGSAPSPGSTRQAAAPARGRSSWRPARCRTGCPQRSPTSTIPRTSRPPCVSVSTTRSCATRSRPLSW